ncbi:uncharacterized protein LOC122003461 isoform X2 [Zingiber officinale]|uniref:uncharacterized protein LOC122003461 isoform X2 n=1 Tax=Zingiber officinale TaxID=94328 RepID=UPI001C4ADE66|nr:uncharacterized protein LOC122003461 isoform X2 [Zingiber officinale]
MMESVGDLPSTRTTSAVGNDDDGEEPLESTNKTSSREALAVVEHCCLTPKSGETGGADPVCPPAPKKLPCRLQPAKRRRKSVLHKADNYFPVPDDLAMVFIPIRAKKAKRSSIKRIPQEME